MISLNITGFYLGLLALLYVGLTINIIRYRIKFQIGIGAGGNQTMAKAIRVHANFIEYTPLAMLLMACYEINGGDPMLLHGLGATFFIGRLLHVKGLSQSVGTSVERLLGMLTSFAVIITLALIHMIHFLSLT